MGGFLFRAACEIRRGTARPYGAGGGETACGERCAGKTQGETTPVQERAPKAQSQAARPQGWERQTLGKAAHAPAWVSWIGARGLDGDCGMGRVEQLRRPASRASRGARGPQSVRASKPR